MEKMARFGFYSRAAGEGEVRGGFISLFHFLITTKIAALRTGLCKMLTGWRRMADGGWRMADGKMRMIKCGWQNADEKMQILRK